MSRRSRTGRRAHRSARVEELIAGIVALAADGSRGTETKLKRTPELVSSRTRYVLRFKFLGSRFAPAAELDRSVHVVRHDLRFAQSWLRRELSG